MSQKFSRFNTGPVRLLLAGLVLAAASTFVLTANAAPADGPGMRHHGGHMAGGDMAGGPMMGGGLLGGRHIERVLDAVNATPEQRSQITQIMESARTDLRAQREAGRGLHEQTRALFVQPTVDARAAETLRQQMLAQHDQASKRTMQAMLEASRVLTPEQRAKLGERVAQRRAMMDRHRGERDSLERGRK